MATRYITPARRPRATVGRPTAPTGRPILYLRARAWEWTDPHEPGAAARPNYNDISAADLEATYLRAKNGANEMNDNEAASRFFIREMRHRRIQHADLFWGAETPGTASDTGLIG